MMYKKSQYTIITKVEEGYWLFNSLYNIKALSYDPKYFSQINKLICGETISAEEILSEIKPFCVEENVDELKTALGMFNYKNTFDNTLRLIIVTTNACNFRCVYCYENHDDVITINDEFHSNLLKAIKDYKNSYGFDKIVIEWFGGEPLLVYDKIISIIDDLNNWCERNNVKYQYTTTTNGYYLTKEKYEKLCSKGFKRFSVTLDGFEKTHNKLRVSTKFDENTWSVIYKNLCDIKDSSCDATILLRANYNFELLSYIDDYVKFLCENFDTPKFAVYFYPIKKWGGENDANIDVIDDSLLFLSSTIILEALNKYKLRSEYYINRLNLFSQICYAADSKSFFINTNGNIQKCSMFPSSQNKMVVIGSISDGKFDINELSNLQYCTPDINLMSKSKCFMCEYLPICYGLGCPYSILSDKRIKCIKEKYDMEKIIYHDYKTRKK